MKEIIDLVLFALIVSGLLFPMLYYTIKETEEARGFVKKYYAQLEQNQDIERKKNEQTINENN